MRRRTFLSQTLVVRMTCPKLNVSEQLALSDGVSPEARLVVGYIPN